ncbi:transmembrane epididymal protein [Actinidia rufa]|uniref:Transmembrane epididymal protein n=1 Tax=Actinidia rufa TaxID=165716 RepID=A0A7J0DPY2_9ERIC|nr:transmembrane epididymal protein [Actinidia rufa]
MELTHSSGTLSGVSGLLAASVFGQELFLLHYHSADHVELEGHYHWILQLIVLVSLIASLSTTSFPSCFPAALVLAISVVFQGFWFTNMGFVLWVPEFVPRGCIAAGNNMHGTVVSDGGGRLRARALANIQFSWILAGIMIFTSCVCLTFARTFRPSVRSSEYEQLHSPGSVAIIGFKQANP